MKQKSEDEVMVEKKGFKKYIIIFTVIFIILAGIGFGGFYIYFKVKNNNSLINFRGKNYTITDKVIIEEVRKSNLIVDARFSLDDLYNENKVPKLGIKLEELNSVQNKIELIEDETVKNEDLEELNKITLFFNVESQVNALYKDKVLVSNYKDSDIQKLESDLGSLKEEWQSSFTSSLNEIKNQKKAILNVDKEVNSYFVNKQKNEVKNNVTRSKYNSTLKRINALPQKDLAANYKKDMDKVLKKVLELEEAARLAELERIRKENEIKAAWKILETPYISQNLNKVYNGCEAASLLMALQYKGYLKNMSIREYAILMPKSDDPHEGFVRDIFGTEPKDFSHWIAPDALAKFGQSSSSARVANISGSSFTTLKKEIDQANPVVIYVTGGSLDEPIWVGEEVPKNLHVVLLIGYNPISKQVVVNDPWTKTSDGKRYYSESKMVSIYNKIGKKAVVIR